MATLRPRHCDNCSGSEKEREVFYYATTRDYSKDEDENLDEKDEEAYEEFWRQFLEEEEKENENANTEESGNSAGADDNTNTVTTGTTGLTDGSSEETPVNVTPRVKLSLRFKEVHCATLLALRSVSILPAIILFEIKTYDVVLALI